jgi:hypothetical protein
VKSENGAENGVKMAASAAWRRNGGNENGGSISVIGSIDG